MRDTCQGCKMRPDAVPLSRTDLASSCHTSRRVAKPSTLCRCHTPASFMHASARCEHLHEVDVKKVDIRAGSDQRRWSAKAGLSEFRMTGSRR